MDEIERLKRTCAWCGRLTNTKSDDFQAKCNTCKKLKKLKENQQ